MIQQPTTLSLESQWISPRRLEWILDVGHCTVADWNKKKLIPHFRDDRIIRYEPQAVLQFIIAKTVRARGAQSVVSSPLSVAQTLPEEAWVRIERLVADQVRAQLERKAA